MRAPIPGLRFLPLLALVAGCQCGPFGVETTRFVCATQADCAEGFECRDLGEGLECIKAGTGSDAGPRDAGRVDSGQPDGAIDAGGVDAGGSDAGGNDAGGTDAGGTDAGGTDAGGTDAGGTDAGGVDAGVDAGTDAGAGGPAALRFATAAQTMLAQTCSQVIVVETINAGGTATVVPSATQVTLSSAPGNVSFYSSSSCAGAAIFSVTIAAGSSSASFYAGANQVRTYTLTASSAPLTPATQQLVVVNAPTSLVFTTTPPDPVRGGTCLPVTVEARRAGTATPVVNATSIGLTVAPTGGARFYSDAACTTSTTTATMAAGASTASLFVKPLTGGLNVITATAPFALAVTQNINTTPIVRAGQCSFPARSTLADGGTQNELFANCTLSPPLTDLSASFSVAQATTLLTTTELGSAEVRCRLGSVTTLACVRRQDADPVDVHYQVAEIPQGMLVQRSTSFNCPPTITLTTPVNQGRSFVLKAVASSTATFDDEDAAIAMLTSPTTLSLTPTSCGGYDTQVVDWAGLTVTAGTVVGGMPAGQVSLTVSGLPSASANRALLLQPGTTVNGARSVCSTLIRAAMPSGSSIVLTRAAGDAGCPLEPMDSILYERIDFGGRGAVREYTVAFAPGVATHAVTITPVDPTRTVVFASSQISAGQGAGEADEGGSVSFTEGVFQLELTSGNTVTATRAASTSSAAVTFYVAELLP